MGALPCILSLTSPPGQGAHLGDPPAQKSELCSLEWHLSCPLPSWHLGGRYVGVATELVWVVGMVCGCGCMGLGGGRGFQCQGCLGVGVAVGETVGVAVWWAYVGVVCSGRGQPGLEWCRVQGALCAL